MPARTFMVTQAHLERARADESNPLVLALADTWPSESPWMVTFRGATNRHDQTWGLTAPGRRFLARWFVDDPAVRPVRVGLITRRPPRLD